MADAEHLSRPDRPLTLGHREKFIPAMILENGG